MTGFFLAIKATHFRPSGIRMRPPRRPQNAEPLGTGTCPGSDLHSRLTTMLQLTAPTAEWVIIHPRRRAPADWFIRSTAEAGGRQAGFLGAQDIASFGKSL
jgi:hypothetical protein